MNDAYLDSVWDYIVEEARETHPAGMKMHEAISILINERHERGIITTTERIRLHGRNDGCKCPNYEHIKDGAPCNPFMDWTEAEKREAWGK